MHLSGWLTNPPLQRGGRRPHQGGPAGGRDRRAGAGGRAENPGRVPKQDVGRLVPAEVSLFRGRGGGRKGRSWAPGFIAVPLHQLHLRLCYSSRASVHTCICCHESGDERPGICTCRHLLDQGVATGVCSVANLPAWLQSLQPRDLLQARPAPKPPSGRINGRLNARTDLFDGPVQRLPCMDDPYHRRVAQRWPGCLALKRISVHRHPLCLVMPRQVVWHGWYNTSVPWGCEHTNCWRRLRAPVSHECLKPCFPMHPGHALPQSLPGCVFLAASCSARASPFKQRCAFRTHRYNVWRYVLGRRAEPEAMGLETEPYRSAAGLDRDATTTWPLPPWVDHCI